MTTHTRIRPFNTKDTYPEQNLDNDLCQAVVAGARLADGYRPAELPTFVAYLASVVLLPMAGVLWARSEPTRWAGTVLAVAAAAVGVMMWRLLQLWEVTGG